jgi:3-methyl-2-oxobutanoate hydroxymethyltransferase
MMCAHGAAVVRGSYHSVVIVDMPFGSYEASPHAGLRQRGTDIEGNRLRGGEAGGRRAMAETIAFLARRGIPVCAHIGLTPQAVNALGGYGARGRSDKEAEKIMADGRAIAEAGAFAVVVEGVLEPIAVALTEALAMPTIGIGASAQCDGQVLVTEDMLGMFERVPRFVKRYADIATHISETAATYAAEVRSRAFPGPEQTYQPKK